MGHGELDQLDKMVQVLGTPTEVEWPDIKKLPNYNKIVLKQVRACVRVPVPRHASHCVMVEWPDIKKLPNYNKIVLKHVHARACA